MAERVVTATARKRKSAGMAKTTVASSGCASSESRDS
jgi:hypothetical protein